MPGAAATLPFEVRMEWDPEDKVWVTYVPILNNLSTYGETYQQALEQTREAILGYLEAAEKEDLPLPFDAEQARALKGFFDRNGRLKNPSGETSASERASTFCKPCYGAVSRPLTFVEAITI